MVLEADFARLDEAEVGADRGDQSLAFGGDDEVGSFGGVLAFDDGEADLGCAEEGADGAAGDHADWVAFGGCFCEDGRAADGLFVHDMLKRLDKIVPWTERDTSLPASSVHSRLAKPKSRIFT